MKNRIMIISLLCLMFSSLVSAYEVTGTTYDLPNDGIGPSGAPAFYNDVSIRMNDNSGQLRITQHGGDFILDDAISLHAGERINYTVLVNYDNAGNMISGTLSIRGVIESLGITHPTQLVTADINEWNLHDDTNLWAFGTTNIVCNSIFVFSCTLSESIYVIFDGPGFDGNYDNGIFTADGWAVTTVPVPAAVLLFGSALALIGYFRKSV